MIQLDMFVEKGIKEFNLGTVKDISEIGKEMKKLRKQFPQAILVITVIFQQGEDFYKNKYFMPLIPKGWERCWSVPGYSVESVKVNIKDVKEVEVK